MQPMVPTSPLPPVVAALFARRSVAAPRPAPKADPVKAVAAPVTASKRPRWRRRGSVLDIVV